MTERKTVKDLLADAKDHSELMVDLAHAAIFFGDDDYARIATGSARRRDTTAAVSMPMSR